MLGVAVTLAGFSGALLRGGLPYSSWDAPAALSPAFVLPLFGLVGLRASASYPAELAANWLFRVTEQAGGAQYRRGVRVAAARSVVLPLLALLFVPSAVVFGPGVALAHSALAAALALITIEWLFWGFPKVPFTCSYLPDKAQLRVSWPKALLVVGLYCAALPEIAAWALGRPWAWLALLVVLAAVWRALVALRERTCRLERLVFEEAPIPVVTRLGLQD